jgi:hypothetical protein
MQACTIKIFIDLQIARFLEENDDVCGADRLFFACLRITFAGEQNGDRGTGAGGFADKRRVCGVSRQ